VKAARDEKQAPLRAVAQETSSKGQGQARRVEARSCEVQSALDVPIVVEAGPADVGTVCRTLADVDAWLGAMKADEAEWSRSLEALT
jgi:hypothetical protein